jgi:hypothetical protein
MDYYVLGVGTSMRVYNYTKVLDYTMKYDFTTIILDHNAGFPGVVKLDYHDYGEAIQIIKSTIGTYKKFVVGGHSASGQACYNSVLYNVSGEVTGILSYDPFSSKKINGTVDVPVLYMGFEKETCLVNKNHSAFGFYNLYPNGALLSYVEKYAECDKVYGTYYYHCQITDRGCGITCETSCVYESVHSDFAQIVNSFLYEEMSCATYNKYPDVNVQVYANKCE